MISPIILLSGPTIQSGIPGIVRAILYEQLPGSQLIHETVHSEKQIDWEIMLRQLADNQSVLLILTIGGIGPVGCVPDATKTVCHKLFPGFGTILRDLERLRPTSSQAVSLFWRNTAGLRHQTLIVNLPDSVETIQAGLPLLFPAIPNAVRLAGGTGSER